LVAQYYFTHFWKWPFIFCASCPRIKSELERFVYFGSPVQSNESTKRSYESSSSRLQKRGRLPDGIMQTMISFGCKHVEFMRRLISCKPLCTACASSTQERLPCECRKSCAAGFFRMASYFLTPRLLLAALATFVRKLKR